MKANRLAALATVSAGGIPHVAAVYFLPQKDLSIFFSTKASGRKYENMVANPTVSMVISNADGSKLTSIQLTGRVRRIENIKLEQKMLLDLWRLRYDPKLWPPPPLQLYERGIAPEIAVMKVVPTEMMMANFEMTDDKRYRPFFRDIIAKRVKP